MSEIESTPAGGEESRIQRLRRTESRGPQPPTDAPPPPVDEPKQAGKRAVKTKAKAPAPSPNGNAFLQVNNLEKHFPVTRYARSTASPSMSSRARPSGSSARPDVASRPWGGC
jgi:hypothetical protein